MGKFGDAQVLTLDMAAKRYWDEVGQKHKNHRDTMRDLERIVRFLGPDKPFDQITDADVTRLAVYRAGQTVAGKSKDKAGKPMRLISNATVNRTTTVLLKGMHGHARRVWKLPLPLEPNWRKAMLKETKARVRQLHAHEAEALYAAIPPDYLPWIEFAHLSGWRFSETLLRWKDVIWLLEPVERNGLTIHGTISTVGKNDLEVSMAITDSIKEILEPLIGHHPEFVFAYIAKSTREGRVRGQRYPIKKEGGKSQWQRIVTTAGLKDFRFHDLRHDAATKALLAGASLKHVQMKLGHTSITTTARYAKVMDDDVAVINERMAKSRKKPRMGVANAA